MFCMYDVFRDTGMTQEITFLYIHIDSLVEPNKSENILILKPSPGGHGIMAKVCITVFIDSLGGSISAPVMPFYAKEFEASSSEIGEVRRQKRPRLKKLDHPRSRYPR